MKNKARRENLTGYSFVLPSLILLMVFKILPILISVVLSFSKYSGLNELTWIGAGNFRELFGERTFWMSMKNTGRFVLIVVPCQTVISLLLAAIIAGRFRTAFGEFVRVAMFIPVLCSSVLAGTIFYYLFASDSEAVMNTLLAVFGIPRQNWLGQRSTALYVICLVNIWKNVGYFLVIFYAGIMDVPRDYYEAASIDGASKLQQFLYITVPGIRSIIYTVVTLGTIWAFQIFDLTYVMTSGGPGNATTSPVLLIYNEAFKNLRLGYSSAIACVLAVLIFCVTMVERKAFGERAGEEV